MAGMDDEAPLPAGRDTKRTVEVRFGPHNAHLAELTLCVPCGRGAADELHATLFELRVQVVRRAVRIANAELTERLHLVELDGASLSHRRRHEIARAVRECVERRLALPGVVKAIPRAS